MEKLRETPTGSPMVMQKDSEMQKDSMRETHSVMTTDSDLRKAKTKDFRSDYYLDLKRPMAKPKAKKMAKHSDYYSGLKMEKAKMMDCLKDLQKAKTKDCSMARGWNLGLTMDLKKESRTVKNSVMKTGLTMATSWEKEKN